MHARNKAAGDDGMASLWATVCMLVVPILLSTLAITQLHRVRTENTSPWKGGGFGMFSSIDQPGYRISRVYLLQGDDELIVQLDGRFRDALRLVTNTPTEEKLKVIAEIFADYTWVVPERTELGETPTLGQVVRPIGIGAPVPEGHVAYPIDAVRLEVWRYAFDSAEGKSSLLLLNEQTARRQG